MAANTNDQIQFIPAGESFSASLLRNAPNTILVINPDMSIRYVNPAFEQQTGFTSAELVGKQPPFPYWIPETHRQFLSGLEKARLSGFGATRVERQYQKKNGAPFWVEVSTSGIGDANSPDFIIAAWIDITERKMAEHELRESEETSRALLDAAPDSAVLIDLEGNIIDINRIAAKRFGKGRHELVGKQLLEIMPLAEAKERQKYIEKAIRTRKRTNFEDEHDKNVYANQIRPVFDDKSKIARLAVFERDITQRKRVEDRLNHAFHEIISSIRTFVPIGETTSQTNLSPRESAITRLLAEGKSTKEISLELKISVKTVETFRTRIMQKLEIYTIAELTKYAVREGLTGL
jgi:PAS domain S-box-containing protein